MRLIFIAVASLFSVSLLNQPAFAESKVVKLLKLARKASKVATASASKITKIKEASLKYGQKLAAEEGKTFAINNVKHAICVSPQFRGKIDAMIADDYGGNVKSIDKILVIGLGCSTDYAKLDESEAKPIREITEPATGKRKRAEKTTASGARSLPVLCSRASAFVDEGGTWREVRLAPHTALERPEFFMQRSDNTRWYRGFINGVASNIRESDVRGVDCDSPPVQSVEAQQPRAAQYCPPGHRGITGTCYYNLPNPYMPVRPLVCVGLSCGR